jgi:hypothetical protein
VSAGWTVGQEVLIVGHSQRHYGTEPDKGTVVKVARKYVTVEQDGPYKSTVEFDMETGYARGEYGYNLHCRTLEQYAADQRRDEVKKALREVGVEFRYGTPKLTTDQLAAILAIVTPEATP